MYNKQYLAKRPFMIVMNTYRPAKGANTTVPGWGDLNGGQWNVFESINFVDRVNDKDLSRAAVIIDVLEAKVVKNSFKEQTANDLLQHFLTKYRAETTEAVGIWMEKQAQERAKAGLPALDLSPATQAAPIPVDVLQASVDAVIEQTGGTVEKAE